LFIYPSDHRGQNFLIKQNHINMDRIVATKVCVCFSEIRLNLGKRVEVERLNE